MIPAPPEDAPNLIYERREIVNAILYVLRSGCPWRLLPHDLPAWGTVYWYFRKWRREGVWDLVLYALRRQVRQQQGRNAQPSAAVIDSQSIKTSAVRGPEKGYDAGKKVWGRKQHLLVHTQGHLLAVTVTGAHRSDQQGAKRLLKPLADVYPKIQVLWGDSHYGGSMIGWIKVHLGWQVQTIRALPVPKHDWLVPAATAVAGDKQSAPGFRPLRRQMDHRTQLCLDHPVASAHP